MHVSQKLSFIPRRIFRLIVPVVLVFCFSLSLGFLFILYHSPRAPAGRLQRLSWQRWDVVSLNADGSIPAGSTGGGGGATNTTGGKEWWELEELDAGETPASVSLPLDVWSPLLPHSTGRKHLYLFCLIASFLTL